LIWLTARQGTASRNSGVAQYKVFEIRSNGFACDSGVYAFRSRSRRGRVGCSIQGSLVCRDGRASLGRIEQAKTTKGRRKTRRPFIKFPLEGKEQA
jgi:hypothetical protein